MDTESRLNEGIKPMNYREERLYRLFDECQNTVIEQVIQPFGLSVAMFNDKDGGGVDTIHNARNGIYAKETEKEKFENRGDYNPSMYHSHSNYKAKNAEVSKQKANGTLVDSYAGKIVAPNAKIDLDHANSAKGGHDDAGAYLADKDTASLVNDPSNLYATNSSINRSKGQKTMEEFIHAWKNGQSVRQAQIAELSQKEYLTDQERKKIENLKALESFSPEEARKISKQAKKQYEREINKYYRSGKFAKSVAIDAGKTAAKTAIQQALGKLLVEFAQSIFHEIKMFVRERKNVTANFFADIKVRLKRVIDRIIVKLKEWKEIAIDLRDGLLAGFLSSLTTTLVNIFASTAKRFVRAIREGIRSLIQTFKLLFFRPEDMTEEDALKFIIKSLSGIFITTVGIVAETALNTLIQSIPVIGQFASIITPVLMGILTGISIAIISYYVDKVFNLFALSEEKFRQLCAVGDLQMEYSLLLLNTGNNIIQMGTAYQQMIAVNEEISENNQNTVMCQMVALTLQETVITNIGSTADSYVKVADSMTAINRDELKKELEETSSWLANRKGRKNG